MILEADMKGLSVPLSFHVVFDFSQKYCFWVSNAYSSNAGFVHLDIKRLTWITILLGLYFLIIKVARVTQ